MEKILEIMDLSYKEFSNYNISFSNRTFYSIIGSNKCGKTTLFKLIASFILTNDCICCNNVYLNKDSRSLYIINLGIVKRLSNNSFIYNNVLDEMMYPLCNLGYSKKYCVGRIKEVLSLFNKEELFDKKINSLNFYDKELLLIMISLLHKPKVVLLDSVLEVFPDNMMKEIINVLKELGITIINFTNSLETAYYTDKIILLNEYKIVGEYNPSDIYQDDKLFYENKLEIPFMVDLSAKLKMYNIVNKEYSNMKAKVDDIWP